MLYQQKNTYSQGNSLAVAKRAGIFFALGLSAICAWNNPVFADENGLIEVHNKVEIARLQLLGACQQQRYDLRQSIVDSARDTMAKKCEKDSDCPSISVSTLTSPNGDTKTKDSDSFNFHFIISQYRGKPEPVLATDSGASTTLEKLVKSKLDKVCAEILNNNYQDPKFFTFADTPNQAPVEADEANALEEIEIAQRVLSGGMGSNDKRRVVAGTGVKVSPAAGTSNDQGPTISPRDGQAQNLKQGAP